MLVFVRILALVYFLSVNLYGFLLIKFQKKKSIEDCKNRLANQAENKPASQTEKVVENQTENKTACAKNSNENSKDNNCLSANENIKSQTQPITVNSEKNCENQLSKVSDGKLILAGILGGALGIYIAMFVYKHRLTSFLLMVLMPVLVTAFLYLLFICFRNNFWIITQSA